MSHEHTLHLSKDRKLKKLIENNGVFTLTKRKNVCIYLCASIMSQQLSTKVADVIYQRFLNLYGAKEPTPEQILNTAPETLRAIGLSNAKVSYVHNVARFAIEQGMDQRKLSKMDDEEVIVYLSQIKGVGRWTVEMLLMFALGRENVFALDDLGIQNAMITLYKLDRADKKQFREDMLRVAKKWVPYRSYACMYLWRYKDNSPPLKNR
jgi:DNA-3-methyladenine glycosylase II